MSGDVETPAELGDKRWATYPTADELVSLRQEIRRVVLDAPPGAWDDETVAAAEVLSAKAVARLEVTPEALR